MTVTFVNMESRVNQRFQNKSNEFVYNFDTEMVGKKYVKNRKSNTFQKAMKITLLIGQIFGLNPVLGILQENVSELRFTYFSARCLYSALSVIGQSVVTFFITINMFWDQNGSVESNSGIVFYGTTTMLTIMFLRIAKEWPKLCRHIARIEEIDPTTDVHLVWKCNTICIVTVVLGAIEHGLHDVAGVSNVMACEPGKPLYDSYIRYSFYWIWVYMPYTKVFGGLAKFFCIQCTFNWNYSGAFIMCVCLYLTARFQQINDRIKRAAKQNAPATFWRMIREDYTKASRLVRYVDNITSGITFVSFGTYLFSICFLILHILHEGFRAPVICKVPVDKRLFKGYDHVVYYMFSVSLLILRSIAMALIAASVNSTSNETALYLYDVSTDVYNVEIQRLITQIQGNTVALSGLKFFRVKRGTVLTIAAAIITYELVLIQFTGIDQALPIKYSKNNTS